MIAHRLSSVMNADEIIVLGRSGSGESIGQIVERGSHAELLCLDGHYARMWNAQTASKNALDESDVSS